MTFPVWEGEYIPHNLTPFAEMQLIRPTSEFEVGHLPFQGKVKGILPRWGRSKPSASTRITFINCDVLSPDFQGRRPVLTLLREEKVAAEPTDELNFIERSEVLRSSSRR